MRHALLISVVCRDPASNRRAFLVTTSNRKATPTNFIAGPLGCNNSAQYVTLINFVHLTACPWLVCGDHMMNQKKNEGPQTGPPVASYICFNDNLQSSRYRDLTLFSTRLARNALAYGNSRFCFLEICKTGSWAPSASSPDASASLLLF